MVATQPPMAPETPSTMASDGMVLFVKAATALGQRATLRARRFGKLRWFIQTCGNVTPHPSRIKRLCFLETDAANEVWNAALLWPQAIVFCLRLDLLWLAQQKGGEAACVT